jgi:hypothetical protein
MSVPSSGEIVQLASFEGGEVDFGAQAEEQIFTSTTTSTTMASSKAGKPASATSSKGSKQPSSMMSSKAGKGDFK